MKTLSLAKPSTVIIALFLALSSSLLSQDFEGSIEFKQYTAKDTTLNMFSVKGNKVKLDQMGKTSHVAEGSFLFDLSTNKIIGLNQSRKVYDNISVNKNAPVNRIDTVIRLKETKTLQGYKCTGYVVKSKSENTQITYWLASGNFNFFSPSVILWNRKDKASVYFRQIKDTKGMFPMLSVESDMNGKEVGKLEVIKIDKKTIDESTMGIPKEYRKMD